MNKKINKIIKNGIKLFSSQKKLWILPVPVVLVLAAVALGGVGVAGALSGWFGGGSSVPSDTFTRGLVGYWSFEEGTGITAHDASNYGNNGVLAAGPLWTRGNVGGALSFDGTDDYVDAGSNASIRFDKTTDFSWSFWIKPNNLTGYQSILSEYNSTNYKFFGLDQAVSGGIRFDYGGSADVTSAIITANVWQYLTFTHIANTTNYLVYVNGDLKDTLVSTGSGVNTANKLIGVSTSSQFPFNGLMDEVRMYNRTLSAQEIRYHYNRGGPVAQWKFDEGEGRTVYDSTDNNNDGTLVLAGSATSSAWVAGKYGSALSFDGVNDYVDAGSGSSLNITQVITIEAWVNSNVIYPTDAMVVRKHATYLIRAVSDGGYNNEYEFFVVIGGVYKSVRSHEATSVGNWYHVVGVYDGTDLRIYMNGALKGTKAQTGSIDATANNLIIGSTLGSSSFFNGSIDDVRIYNYARTPDEIRLDYNAGFAALFGPQTGCDQDPGSCMTQGLVSYWNMDEGSGGLAHDSSGYAYNGTLTSGPSWTKGKVGGGLNFDGVNDIVNRTTFNEIDGASAASFEAWIKPDVGLFGLTDISVVVWKQGVFALGGGWTAHKVQFYPWWDVGQGTSGASLTSVDDGNWHHIVGVYDGAYLRIYVDGVQENSSNVGAKVFGTDATVKLGIGARDSGGGAGIADYLYKGAIDEVKIYNRALSAEEVRYHYNRGGPVAYWKFDEGTGGFAYDTTDNNNDGDVYKCVSGNTHDAANTCTATFYPDANPESTSVDGVVYRAGVAEDWATIRSGAGTGANDDGTLTFWGEPVNSTPVGYRAVLGGSTWQSLERAILVFDTSGIPDSAVISAATLSLYGQSAYNQSGIAGNKVDINIYSSTPVSSTALAAADYGNLGSTAFSTTILFSNFNAAGYNNFALNASGIAAISLTGVSKFGARDPSHDVSGTSPTYSSNAIESLNFWSSEQGAGYQPKLAVTYVGATTSTSPTWTSGKYGSALSFDGVDDWVDAGNVSSNARTVSFWLKRGDTSNKDVIDLGTPEIKITSNAITSTGLTSPTYYVDGIRGNTAVAANEWHYITITDTADISASNVDIGKASSNYFLGLIDDVRIYNYARTPSQIQQDYNAGFAALFGPQTGCDQDPGSCMTQDLVGYWNFEEGSGTIAHDASNYANNGSSTMASWTKGKVGGGLIFDGTDDYVTIPDSDLWAFGTNPFTIEMWVKNSSTANKSFFTQGNNNDTDMMYFDYQGTGNSRFAINSGGVVQLNFTLPSVGLNAWTHVVFVRAGNTAADWNVYYDTVAQTKTLTAGGYTASVGNYTETLRLGCRYSGSACWTFWNGLIDEVKIYNRALSTTEVRYHYNKGGPIAQWKMDEGEGTTAYDSTDNNNDGTLTSGPTWVVGKYGSALSFDGANDYVDKTSPSNIPNGSTARTIEAWINPANINPGGIVVGLNDTGATAQSFIVAFTTSGGLVYLFTDGKNTSNNLTISGSQVPSIGIWSHIAFTYDNNNWAYYLNGSLAKNGSFATAINTDADNISVGRRGDGGNTGTYFPGLIDDVRIYNYARNASQIQQDYNQGLGTHFK